MNAPASTMLRQSVAAAGKQVVPGCGSLRQRALFSTFPSRKTAEAPPKASGGFVPYDWKDALRIESTLLTEDEVAIKYVHESETCP